MINYKGQLFDCKTEEEAEYLINFKIDAKEDLLLTNEAKKDDMILNAREYLHSTDWYFARKLETGEEVPVHVATKRAESREFIRSQEDV